MFQFSTLLQRDIAHADGGQRELVPVRQCAGQISWAAVCCWIGPRLEEGAMKPAAADYGYELP